MATHVRRACRKALASYLESQVSGSKTRSEWPAPGDKLPPRTLTVILVPAGDTETRHQPIAISQQEIPNDTVNALVLYTWGLVEFGLQIDAWASNPAEAAELEMAVEAALNRPASVTLGMAPSWALDLAPGLVLKVDEHFETPASFRFKAMPQLPESGTAAQAGRYRATWMGSCTARLLMQQRRPRITSLTLTQSGSGGSSSDVLFP